MTNPWLGIPAADYEAHMALPEVGQARALAALFASALEEYAPESLAVPGCATGNGFEHIDASKTRRVAAARSTARRPAARASEKGFLYFGSPIDFPLDDGPDDSILSPRGSPLRPFGGINRADR